LLNFIKNGKALEAKTAGIIGYDPSHPSWVIEDGSEPIVDVDDDVESLDYGNVMEYMSYEISLCLGIPGKWDNIGFFYNRLSKGRSVLLEVFI
jgi:hypothetical protein